MFSLFHKPDSAQATLGTDETACEASNAVAGSGQAGAGISPQPERSMPQESAAGEAGRESPLSAADGQAGAGCRGGSGEIAAARPSAPAQTSVRAEGGKSEGASLSSEAPGARWGQTPGAEPLLRHVGDARTAHHLELVR